MCMCLRVWCMTQWVSWVCWRCLPKLQRGWRFSTNPASLEGAPYPNHSVFPMQPAIISEREGESMWEKQVHRRLCVHSFCTRILQTEINLLTSPERLHANALLTPKCHASSSSVLPIPLSLPLSFGLFLFCLSFPPFSLSHSTHLSAALHCWRQQPGSPLYFWVPQIDTGLIKKHHSPINSPACLCSNVIEWE